KKQLESNRRKILGNSMTLGLPSSEPLHKSNFLQVSTNIAKAIIGTSFDKLVKKRDKINKKGKPESMVLDCELEIKMEKQVRTLEGSNVLAYVEGQDPVLKNELVVVTAHYD